MNTNKLVLSAALLAMAISSPTALAGPKEKPAKEKPFKASLAVAETLGPPCASDHPNPLAFGSGNITVIGKASHMGRVSGDGIDCINIIPPDPDVLPSFIFTNENLTLTAANGDKLFLLYEGSFTPTTPPTVVPSIYEIKGEFQVQGGTGRFEGATGSGIMEGSEVLSFPPPSDPPVPPSGQGHVELIGTISY